MKKFRLDAAHGEGAPLLHENDGRNKFKLVADHFVFSGPLQALRQFVLALMLFFIGMHVIALLVQHIFSSASPYADPPGAEGPNIQVVNKPNALTQPLQAVSASFLTSRAMDVAAKADAPVLSRRDNGAPVVAKAIERVGEPESAAQDFPRALQFVTKSTGNNYADCAGLYKMSTEVPPNNQLNGRPFYVFLEKDRFLAWTGAQWEITAMQYLPAIRTHHDSHGFWPGSFGGFHKGATGARSPHEGLWADYDVKPVSPSTPLLRAAGASRIS